MENNPNAKTDPNKGQPNNDDGKNTITISKDAFDAMKTNQMHIKNTLNNLSTKFENLNKSNSKPTGNDLAKHDDKSSHTKSDNGDDNKLSYAELLNKVNSLTQRENQKDQQSKLTSYTKQQLKANKIAVNKDNVQHMMGKDKDAIDANIKFYAPIFKRAQKVHIQQKPKHHKNKGNIGAGLAKQNNSQTDSLSHYFR